MTLVAWTCCSESLMFQSSVFEASIFSRLPSILVRQQRRFCTIALSARRNRNSSSSTATPKKANKRSSNPILEDDVDEDAFEKLFSMLEEDLNNDELDFDDDDDEDITEEEMDKLQAQFEQVLGVSQDGEPSTLNVSQEGLEDDEGDLYPKLKTWQLRRLALALKTGRRKISIKNLAAELCLDRSVVLKYLRDPPPTLLMMNAALPDEPAQTPVIAEDNVVDVSPTEVESDVYGGVSDHTSPIHVLRQQWSAQKRIKKVHVETLERVYRRTKRPTDAMISSIVQVTNLPRRRVLKWFEDKRAEDISQINFSNGLTNSFNILLNN